MPVGKVRQYPYFVRLFHTSIPLRSVELRMKKESRDLVASTGHLCAERYKFQKGNQVEGQSIREFLARLQKLAETCKFGGYRDEALRDRLV